MRLFHRHRNKKNSPVPDREDLISPFNSSAPLPPIRNFSYPNTALQSPTAPPISSAAHLPPTAFREAQKTSTLSRDTEPPFYWASSYKPIRAKVTTTSADSRSSILNTAPETFGYG
ncbi:hypothetical protein CORC01_05767 [Colletotrichum orchidophilum]|uniref:Uncharacterized protein n=1 Tax=Colletotrichum orchidophilum TaxID=1209926 RepID=A0A1G4BBW4_9PEZI|nr:uncharacterized protein CORC01_05767 [Colletotrichum orchidophilum]OHE98871.1 hypothetical protein CORC01_05767 [Colletotrichum orchidophilum]